MFGKLLKHEFRATAPMILLTWLVLIGFTALSALFGFLAGKTEVFLLPMMITTFFAGTIAFAALIVVYVIIIRRFYTNVFGDEGYLTLTLPVTRGSIIWSKLLCAMIWLIGTSAVVFGSVTFRAAVESTDAVQSFINAFGLVAARIVNFTGIPVWGASTELFIFLAVSLVRSILVFYAAIALGQFLTGHRLLGSVLAYLGLGVVERILNTGYTVLMGISHKGLEVLEQFYYGYALDSLTGFEVQVSVIVYIVLLAVEAALLWLLTDLVLRKAVNLQ